MSGTWQGPCRWELSPRSTLCARMLPGNPSSMSSMSGQRSCRPLSTYSSKNLRYTSCDACGDVPRAKWNRFCAFRALHALIHPCLWSTVALTDRAQQQARPGRPSANIARPVVDRRTGSSREREKEASGAGSSSNGSKNKGMSCRFCGKVFTHAPAHLQHERAHLQQQETKNP